MNWKQWVRAEAPPSGEIRRLAVQLSQKGPFPEVLAQILLQRGVTDLAEASRFFRPAAADLHDPFLMQDMDRAADRMLRALQQQEMILLYGDYDVDGTSAVTLMTLALGELGFRTCYYLPDRYTEGYGVSYRGIDYAESQGAALILSLDCGIKSADKVGYAARKGIDFIVCDHHTPGEALPPALAVLDPRRPDCLYPYKELTGCGVGFKLLQAISIRMRGAGLPVPENFDPFTAYCDLITLSIACDIVPITGENRTIAWHGLQKLRSNPLPGIQALMNQAREPRTWDISDLVFFIGPRINAAGRLYHASHAVEVLLGHSLELDGLAESLHTSNEERKTLDRQMTEEALALIGQDPGYAARSTTVLYHPEWHKGVIGIVASRLIEQHYRPTVLLTRSDGKLVGSARSVAGFDLYAALDACTEHLIQFGGHKYAAGLSLWEDQLDAFRSRFDAVVSGTIEAAQRSPVLQIDAQVSLRSVDERLAGMLSRMEPFGPENLRPVFEAQGLDVVRSQIMKDEHLRLTLDEQGARMDAVAFGMAAQWERLGKPERIDIAFQPVLSTWNQQTRIELRLKDLRPSA
ncbi:MAG: single-stranded-DNA-specific exonuclease RecJ [Bacteroidia bacterium]|nr:single-stranded-DNA-specific exonuclease RecJ [Bacteroidia bacterium]